jgi:hypothetical protein
VLGAVGENTKLPTVDGDCGRSALSGAAIHFLGKLYGGGTAVGVAGVVSGVEEVPGAVGVPAAFSAALAPFVGVAVWPQAASSIVNASNRPSVALRRARCSRTI